MDFGMAILTALLTFISPCVLPMLPVFVTYFTAGESNRKRTFINALGFALGLIIVLTAIGALFTALGVGVGSFVGENIKVINIIAGCIVILMGLAFMDVIKIPFLTGGGKINVKTDNMRFFSALIFGLVYAISFGPCIVTLGSFSIMQAVLDAVETGQMLKGILLQLTYGAVLGILFIISAMLIDVLKGFFSFVKRHYRIINLVSGIILIILGILMATGMFTALANYFNSKASISSLGEITGYLKGCLSYFIKR